MSYLPLILAAEAHLRGGTFEIGGQAVALAHQSDSSENLPRIEYFQGPSETTGNLNNSDHVLATSLLIITAVGRKESETNRLAEQILARMDRNTELVHDGNVVGYIAGTFRVGGSLWDAGTIRVPITIPLTN